MLNNILKQMISEYKIENDKERENAIKQIIQEIVLSGLSRSGFFENVAFCGGTALRIFYGLDRFSEDLDFSLIKPDKDFKLERYFPMLEKELNAFGIKMEIKEVEKNGTGHVQTAFIKGNTRQLYLLFYTDDKIINRLHRDSLIRIKFEIDILPPPYAKFEHKIRELPAPYQVQIYDIGSLFAGKLHAVLARKWRNRTKGRDLYDFSFYVNKGIKFNLKHLESRLKQSETIDKNKNLTLKDVREMLNRRFDSFDYEAAKDDAENFVSNNDVLKIWNANSFKELTKKLESE